MISILNDKRARMAQAPMAALAALALALLACVFAAALVPGQAFANRELNAPIDVSDDITRIHVDKVDYGNREPLKDAKMQILVKETGEVVDEWETDGTTHETDKRLDVEVDYILREVEAPEGYSKVPDTIFRVNEMEGTGITIISPNLDDPDESRYIDLADGFRVTLYDPGADIEVRTEDRVVPGEKVVNNKTKSVTKSGQPKTGDNVPTIAVSALVGVVIVAAFLLLLARRRNRNSDEKE